MSYGVPHGSQIDYGSAGFPDWVYQLGQAFGLKASTYPGHQETNRNEAGYAPNPQLLNRGIDWAGSVENMQRFADYCFSIRRSLEQVIWQNPNTGQRIGVAGGNDVTNTPYFASDYGGHTDHVHTRQSDPIPSPGDAAPGPVQNTFFADVSEFQVPVDDSYPYPVLSIRVSDGTYRDHKFAQNYAWMRAALDSGRLTFGIIYTYVRTNWQANADTVRAMIDANGGLHPRVALMLDVESGGNPSGDGSDWINHLYWNLADYASSPARIIGYANKGDFNSMWRQRPDGLRVIGAGYGTNPNLPGQRAHQYTDGVAGGNQGLPMGCTPFGNCDMNVADNLSPQDFAAACGIGSNTWDTVLNEIMGV